MFTAIVARFVAHSRFEDLSAEAVSAAKRALLDFTAVTLAGSQEDVAAIVTQRAREMKGSEEATVVRGGFKANAHVAAYVNGTMAHALDYDDVIHLGPLWMGHPSVAIVPAALAVAERNNSSGKNLLLAYCVGMEVYAKTALLCGDAAYKNGWHNTSFIGTMAAAAAAAKLLALDETQVRHCFGIAASLAGGLRQNFGTMVKPLHAGIAARNGVEAADLAKAGLTADLNIYEAKLGFKNVFTGNRADIATEIPYGAEILAPDEFASRLGNPWNMADPGLAFKICPSCRATHFGMEAALEFREASGRVASQIVEVECHVPSHMGSVLFHHNPVRGLEGKFSLEYVLARTILDGPPKISDFTNERVNQAVVKRLMTKLRWLPFEPEAGSFGVLEFIFRMDNGEALHYRVEYPRGEPENPVSNGVLAAKFHDCAAGVVPASAAEQIERTILHAEDLASVRDLSTLLL